MAYNSRDTARIFGSLMVRSAIRVMSIWRTGTSTTMSGLVTGRTIAIRLDGRAVKALTWLFLMNCLHQPSRVEIRDLVATILKIRRGRIYIPYENYGPKPIYKSQVRAVYQNMINQATDYVYHHDSCWSSIVIWQKISAPALRGVDVRIVTHIRR